MSKASESGELEIVQDLRHERLEWRIERASWVLMAVVLGAALLGLFGSGPLANAHAGAPDGPLWIDYSRFARRLAPAMLEVHFSPAALRTDEDGTMLRLAVDADYARSINIDNSTPAPEHEEVSADTIVYVYNVSDLRSDAVIQIRIIPDVVGLVHGRIGAEGMAPLAFSQFVYP